MTISSKQPDTESDASARERIDALLDEALMESFPASDSFAIGSSISAIKRDHRERADTEDSLLECDAERHPPVDASMP